MWNPFKTREKQPTDTDWVDTDRTVILSNDQTDATSLLFALSMEHSGTMMSWDPKLGVWHLEVAGKEFSAPTQIEALREARRVLG